MNRKQIKLRAWNHKSKEMSYDVCVDMYGHANDGTSFLTYSDKDETMLFSGLLDCNRKPIYEGDIVTWKGLMAKKQIWFKDGAFRTLNAKRSPSRDSNVLHGSKIHRMKICVIGNVFENKNLLKY